MDEQSSSTRRGLGAQCSLIPEQSNQQSVSATPLREVLRHWQRSSVSAELRSSQPHLFVGDSQVGPDMLLLVLVVSSVVSASACLLVEARWLRVPAVCVASTLSPDVLCMVV